MTFYDDYLTIHTLLTHSRVSARLLFFNMRIFIINIVSVSHMWVWHKTGFSLPRMSDILRIKLKYLPNLNINLKWLEDNREWFLVNCFYPGEWPCAKLETVFVETLKNTSHRVHSDDIFETINDHSLNLNASLMNSTGFLLCWIITSRSMVMIRSLTNYYF